MALQRSVCVPLRTAVLAAAFAWIARRGGDLDVSSAIGLAVVMWVGFPLVLLTGSVLWEKVHPATAAMHAGDWLVKLLLIAVILGLLHYRYPTGRPGTGTGQHAAMTAPWPCRSDRKIQLNEGSAR